MPQYLRLIISFATILLTLFGGLAIAQAPGPGGTPGLAPPPVVAMRVERNVEYARVGNRILSLDLYLPPANLVKEALPVVVWVHGGGWIRGDKFPTPAARLVANGYAVASVDYRLSNEALFPAQLHDVKAAVRWLRANAKQYKLDAAYIGAWGESAGAHLAALLGTTGDVKELEGTGGNLDQSSRVQAVVDFYGPIDFMRMDATATKPKTNQPELVENQLLGTTLLPNKESEARAKVTNPITYLSKDDAPFLIVHGTGDQRVPSRQSEYFQIALKAAGVENDLEYVIGADHVVSEVQTPAVAELVNNFFDKHLRGNQHQRDDINAYVVPKDSFEDPIAGELGGTRYQLFAAPSLATSRGANMQASYRVYLPPGYADSANASRRYPVIYYLHGLNDDSRRGIRNGYIQRADAAMRSGIMPLAIIIMVQGLNHGWYVDSADGKWPMESVVIKDLIPHVDKTYRTIATRAARAIEGHSMGGAGALHLGFKYPEMFGSVASIAAALIPKEQFTSGMNLDMLNTMFGGDIANYEAEGAWTLVEKNADKIRGRTNIRLICGDKDNLLARSQWFDGILTRLNIDHQLIESKGAPHASKEVLARLEVNPFEFYGKAFAAFK